jgi:hypothetical protein
MPDTEAVRTSVAPAQAQGQTAGQENEEELEDAAGKMQQLQGKYKHHMLSLVKIDQEMRQLLFQKAARDKVWGESRRQ